MFEGFARVIPLGLECYNLLVSGATGESFFSSIFLSAQENRHNKYEIILHNTNNMYYVQKKRPVLQVVGKSIGKRERKSFIKFDKFVRFDRFVKFDKYLNSLMNLSNLANLSNSSSLSLCVKCFE